ncbi:MAG: hypothetical protein JXR07_07645 [Reichenbachiella sp.]
MRKFKTFFYGIYFLFFTFSAFIALNYENLVLHWDWDPIGTWTGLIRFVLKLGGVGLALFGIEIIVENIHLFSKRRKIKSLEKEVLDIKARLYDASQEENSDPLEKPTSFEEKPNEELPIEQQQEEQDD